MKKIVQNNLFALVLLTISVPAFAEAGAREDNSMMLVYVFLATCGLIIFLQLIPVFTIVYGLIKGMFSKKEEEIKPAPAKHRS
ncbi:MAG: hypothetical protein OQK50_02280 [Deltaproteobacteria bacterium]|jgi:TctA family transporter|nr:hypothetical protein [Deltaproteobacteria bacterium]MCW8893371.1 hypothetical protein [Deltaproteobacteria bacterium]MCW9049143.1 hypothetical protein [Deltaproteobacteria bacterium]